VLLEPLEEVEPPELLEPWVWAGLA
jgi:hypothetical protein